MLCPKAFRLLDQRGRHTACGRGRLWQQPWREYRHLNRASSLRHRTASHRRRHKQRPRPDPGQYAGHTLYLFLADSGTTSACGGACAAAWPPLRTNSQPTVGAEADASLVGTTSRSDGGPQVTYNGHPVYLFVHDQKPGDTNGEGVNAFGASWYALSPAGRQITGPAALGGPSSSGGGGGY
jgi:predicted lipoprotein with Yx(FWY)xxD motif